jgi:proteasome beta subunit
MDIGEANSASSRGVPQDKILKGTTTVAIAFNDGVVLAADRRATMGTFIASKEVDKIAMIGDKIALTLAGAQGDTQALVRLLKAELELYKFSKGSPMNVAGAATLLSNILQGTKYFPYYVQLILAGYDNAPHVFDVDLIGGIVEEKYASTGSGSPVAYGLLDDGFKPGLTREQASKLAAKSVSAAIKREAATGEEIDVIIITKDGSKRLSREEVKAVLAQ